jgi:hypothetical protein
MNARQRNFLVNLNRTVIFTLTLGGLLMDGYQGADLPCTVALFLWLWLPLCTRLECHLLQWVRRQYRQTRSANLSSSV